MRLSGDARDDRVLEDARRRCLAVINPGRRRLVLDFEGVRDADTKLVASLVDLFRRARRAGVVVDLRVSPCVRDWMALCRVEQFLWPDGSGSGAG